MNLYSNAAPLVNCEYKDLNRQIGVTIYDRMLNHATYGDAVQICYERLALNTAAFGGWKPTGQAVAHVQSMTEVVIDTLDLIIAELTEHRARLIAEMPNISASVLDALAAPQF